jgi:AraC family transcriptional regulator
MTGPKAASRQSYHDRIERVAAHIRSNLDAPLDLDALADVACLSRFHWHRIYQAITGETSAQTVRRLRLARAAADLADTRDPLTWIAERAGYASQSAFTRAFTAAHGMAPA